MTPNVKGKIKLDNMQGAVTLAINAMMPQFRADVEAGVKAAIDKLDVKKLASQQAKYVLETIVTEEIRAAIEEAAKQASRDQLRGITKDAVEALFRRWLSTIKDDQNSLLP